MAMATSKMVTPAFPAPDKQRCADPDTDEFGCDEMICSEFNMMMGGALLGRLLAAPGMRSSGDGHLGCTLSAPSPKKLNANRQNAKKSTGPKTLRGKAHSRRNALKHGLFAGHWLEFFLQASSFRPISRIATRFSAFSKRAARLSLHQQSVIRSTSNSSALPTGWYWSRRSSSNSSYSDESSRSCRI